MTPYELCVLLHYYVMADDHEDVEANPPVWRPTVDKLKAHGLLCDDGGNVRRSYALTERGEIYVELGLCAVPLPVRSWHIPARDEAEG